jgi:putative two-component system response regulator
MLKQIFIVDDNDSNLTAAAQALETMYKVFTFPTPEKMFVVLKKIIPDLILLDIEIPEHMNGFDALAQLKENPNWDDIPVLFLTGWNDEMIASRSISMGALDFVAKPIVPSILLNRVNNYINGVARS